MMVDTIKRADVIQWLENKRAEIDTDKMSKIEDDFSRGHKHGELNLLINLINELG